MSTSSRLISTGAWEINITHATQQMLWSTHITKHAHWCLRNQHQTWYLLYWFTLRNYYSLLIRAVEREQLLLTNNKNKRYWVTLNQYVNVNIIFQFEYGDQKGHKNHAFFVCILVSNEQEICRRWCKRDHCWVMATIVSFNSEFVVTTIQVMENERTFLQ